MGLSKKLLFGLVGSVAATTVVVGTSVGLVTNATTQNTNVDKSTEENNLNNSSNKLPSNDDSNIAIDQPTKSKETAINQELDVKKIAAELNSSSVVIKTTTEDKDAKSIAESMLYAFNVQSNQLLLKSDIKLPKDAKVEFELEVDKNTSKLLNEGKLAVKITIEDKTKNNVKGIANLTLEGFKASYITNGVFKDIFETNTKDRLVLKVTPKKQEAKYVSLSFLNDEIEVASSGIVSSDVARLMHNEEVSLEPDSAVETVKENGLSSWIKMDETKKTNLSKATVSGKVKLETISKNKENNNTYFHLVSKNKTQKLKLSIGKEQIVFDEIKTVNLLAEEVVIYPIGNTQEKDKEFVEALLKTNQTEDAMPKYIQTSERLSVDLAKTSEVDMKHKSNLLFVNAYSIDKTTNNSTNLPVGIELKYGKEDYATTFKTGDETQLNILKEAGFSFGIYVQKIDGNDQSIKASLLTDEKKKLSDYFKSENYASPKVRMQESGDKYPGDFSLMKIENNALAKEIIVNLGQSAPQTSENYLFFVDYSYLGIDMSKFLLTPSISLVHLNMMKTQ